MQRYRNHILLAALAVSIPAALRQATPCQQQQADPNDTTEQLLDKANQNLSDMSDLADKYVTGIADIDAERASLKQQVLDLLAGDAAKLQKARDLWDKSEEVENKLRAGLPGVPPVGGEPLLQSYSDRAAFDSAVSAYQGPEAVNVDGTEVKSGTSPALEYFTHSSDGSVSTTGPTD